MVKSERMKTGTIRNGYNKVMGKQGKSSNAACFVISRIGISKWNRRIKGSGGMEKDG